MANNNIEVVKAVSRQAIDDFVRLPHRLYAGVPQYVPDLDADIRDTISGNKKLLDGIDVVPFVAYRDGRCVGRVAGIVNHHANAKWQQRNVRFSMIEFEDDLDISRALLQAVAAWGREQQMDTLLGPLGTTDFDKEGMLIEDFDRRGSFLEYYNLSYYPRHMEQLGFEKAVDWLQVRVAVPDEAPAVYGRVAQYAMQKFGLRVVRKTRKDFATGYAYKVFDLLNKAYAPLFGFVEFTRQQVDVFVKEFIMLVDPRMLVFVENAEGELVCVALTITDFSEGLQKSGGRLLPFGWYHILRSLKWHRSDTVEMMLIGVRPDLQGLGLNALCFNELIPVYQQLGYNWAETGPQLEHNVKELSQWKHLNPQMIKRRRCWQIKLKD